MHIKKTTWDRCFDAINYTIMVLLILCCAYPIIYVIFASFSDEMRIVAHQGPLISPLGFSTLAYEKVLMNERIISGYLNTNFIVIVGTSVNIFLTILGAYFLSRRGVMLKMPIFFMILLTMYFSGGLIPLYFTVKGIGLDNSIFAAIFPVAINTYNLIVMRTGFDSIPRSLEEAAEVDGANDILVLFRIIVPLAVPTIMVVTLYYLVAHWNAWFNAMIFIRDRSKQPLQLVLREILIANDTNSMTTWSQAGEDVALGETIKYATIIVATVPILCVYLFMQKYFIKGVMIGAVKG